MPGDLLRWLVYSLIDTLELTLPLQACWGQHLPTRGSRTTDACRPLPSAWSWVELGEVDNVEQLTCLAEYRNGGLLVDTGVLKLKAVP